MENFTLPLCGESSCILQSQAHHSSPQAALALKPSNCWLILHILPAYGIWTSVSFTRKLGCLFLFFFLLHLQIASCLSQVVPSALGLKWYVGIYLQQMTSSYVWNTKRWCCVSVSMCWVIIILSNTEIGEEAKWARNFSWDKFYNIKQNIWKNWKIKSWTDDSMS